MVPRADTPDAVPAAGEMLGVGMRFNHATLGERGTSGGSTRGGIYWVATAPGALRPEPPAAQLTLLRRWFADWRSPVAELLEATEPDDLVQQPGGGVAPAAPEFGFPVGGGGFVLLGDAAHVHAPILTQGACLAFEDAATLGSLMRRPCQAATSTCAWPSTRRRGGRAWPGSPRHPAASTSFSRRRDG